MKKIIEVLTPWEAIRVFIATEELRKMYAEESELFRNMDLSDDNSIMEFLDGESTDFCRLNSAECELLGLDYNSGWYIEDYNRNYLSTVD